MSVPAVITPGCPQEIPVARTAQKRLLSKLREEEV
jgi:hypothetical protein